MFIRFYCCLLVKCSLYLLLGRAYTTPKAFGLYFKGPLSSFGLATPYSIWEHQNFTLNNGFSTNPLILLYPYCWASSCYWASKMRINNIQEHVHMYNVLDHVGVIFLFFYFLNNWITNSLG